MAEHHTPINPLPTPHSTRDRAGLRTQEQQASAHRLAYASTVVSHAAYLKWGECEGHTITTAAHHSQNHSGTLRTSGFRRPTEGAQEDRQNGASVEISRKIEGEKHGCDCVGLLISKRNGEGLLIANFHGAWGCPDATRCNWHNCFEIMVSAAGFEPATHALKGHCSTN